MKFPSKKHVVGFLTAMTLSCTLLLGCAFANSNDKVVQELPEPTIEMSANMLNTESLNAVRAVTLATTKTGEAIATRASEQAEVVNQVPAVELTPAKPALDRTKPLYEVYKDGWKVDVPVKLQWYIRDNCIKYDYPEKLVYGMVLTESTFDPTVSGGGCYGLAQINKFWIRGANITHFTDDYRSRNLLDPYDNLLTMFEMWEYATETYGLDPWTQSGQVKLLYWHNTGKDPRNVSNWKYATKAIRHGNELVALQGQ